MLNGDETATELHEILIEVYNEIKNRIRRKNKTIFERWKAGGFIIDSDIMSMYPNVETVIEELESEDIYSVVAGNVGTVYSGTEEERATEMYYKYVEMSKDGVGRIAGGDVALTLNGEIIEEFSGAN